MASRKNASPRGLRHDEAAAGLLGETRIALLVAVPRVGAKDVGRAADRIGGDLATELDFLRQDFAPAVVIPHAPGRAVGERRGRIARPAVTAVTEGGDFGLGCVDRGEDAPRAIAARYACAEKGEHQRYLGIDPRIDPREGTQRRHIARLANESEAAGRVEPRQNIGQRRRTGVTRPGRSEDRTRIAGDHRGVGQRRGGVHAGPDDIIDQSGCQ